MNLTKQDGRLVKWWEEGDGVIVSERTRYAPRKYDEQRVYLNKSEVEKLFLQVTEKCQDKETSLGHS